MVFKHLKCKVPKTIIFSLGIEPVLLAIVLRVQISGSQSYSNIEWVTQFSPCGNLHYVLSVDLSKHSPLGGLDVIQFNHYIKVWIP